jgi:hypothetical protein
MVYIAYFKVLNREDEAEREAETRAKLEAIRRNRL